ncbi:MAG TPA: TonB-dependent receptor, partial [Longimicrobiales bacterium]|nr:TonB-dependent receptor [Longimicrobiales bacterium]
VQDLWEVTPRLTATLGLRYDRQSFDDDPLRVLDVERAFNITTGIAPTDDDNISPRLSLAYDLNGDGRQVVRGGLGYFYGRVPYVLGGNVMQTQRPGVEVVCSGSLLEGDPDAPPPPSRFAEWDVSGMDNPSGCAGDVGASGLPTYSFWTEDFEFPETLKASLGYEGMVTERTRLSLDLLFSETTKQYSVRNVNLRDVQFQIEGEDGRRIYTPASIFNPTAANTPGAWRNTDFGDVFANYSDGRGRAYNAALEVNHGFSERLNVAASYTFTRAYDNVSESCCTSSGIYTDATVGAYGPNDLGGIGDYDKAWGRSDYNRDHTVIFSGFARELPLGLELSAFWRLQSGRPYTPEVQGDLNGDGVRFNDRPFVFAPEDLPLAATGEAADELRAEYARILADNDCVGDYVGQIVERNTCAFPWTNRLDVRATRRWNTFPGQRAELQIDLFNVLNGVGRLLCDEESDDLTEGSCGWGRVTGVFGRDRNLLEIEGFDAASNRILYAPGSTFGREDVLGSNLLLQFQAQIGFKYYF